MCNIKHAVAVLLDEAGSNKLIRSSYIVLCSSLREQEIDRLYTKVAEAQVRSRRDEWCRQAAGWDVGCNRASRSPRAVVDGRIRRSNEHSGKDDA